MKRRIIYFVTWCVSLAVLVGFFLMKPERIDLLIQTPPLLFIKLCLLVATTWFIVYLQAYFTLAAIAKPPPFLDYLSVFFLGLLINYSPIRIGVAARAYYLAKYHSVNLSTFSALSIFRLLVMILISGLVAGTAILLLPSGSGPADSLLFLLLLGCVVIPFAIFAGIRFDYWKKLPTRLTAGPIANFGQSFKQLNHKLGILSLISALVFLQFVLVAVRMKLCFDYAGIDIGTLALLVLAPLGTLLSVLSITPGGIGVREFVVASVSTLLGYSFEQGMQALVIDRLSMIAVALVLGGGSVPILFLRKERVPED